MNQFPNFGDHYESQRGYFAAQLYEEMLENDAIYLLLGDLGYGIFDKHREKFPDRVINCGASEVAMMGMAVGLAQSGKIPFVYSITPFLLYRPFEVIRNYINQEQIPVKLIGSGRNTDYSTEGFSHHAEDDRKIVLNFKNINSFWPETKEAVPSLIKIALKYSEPYYINLKK